MILQFKLLSFDLREINQGLLPAANDLSERVNELASEDESLLSDLRLFGVPFAKALILKNIRRGWVEEYLKHFLNNGLDAYRVACINLRIDPNQKIKAALEDSDVISIDLKRNSITYYQVIALTCALKYNNTVKKLNLSVNSIGTRGAELLASLLRTNSTVEEINLSVNTIDSQGTAALADALKVNDTVKKIYLWDNPIGTEGRRVLEDLKRLKPDLRILY